MNKQLKDLLEGLKSGRFEIIETTRSNRHDAADEAIQDYGFSVKLKTPVENSAGAED